MRGNHESNKVIKNEDLEFIDARTLQLIQEIDRLNSIINAMQSSRSWVVTKPFRTYAAMRREDAVERMVKRYERKIMRFPKSITISSLPPSLDEQSIRSEYTVGAIVHIHFRDVIEDLISPLAQISKLQKVFVTYNDPSIELEIMTIIAQHLNSNVLPTLLLVENRGRDVLPFLQVLNYLESNPEQKCDAYLKLHTKKSTHLDNGQGEMWRNGLIRSLVPSDVDEIAQYVSSNSNLGFAAPLSWVAGNESWGRNRKLVRSLMRRAGYSGRGKLIFPAGTMFWFNSNFIDLIQNMGISDEEFELELGQLDGTTAHAFERVVGAVSLASDSDVWLIE